MWVGSHPILINKITKVENCNNIAFQLVMKSDIVAYIITCIIFLTSVLYDGCTSYKFDALVTVSKVDRPFF
jgi:hypothetical protein